MQKIISILPELFIILFLLVTFLQSGIDKITNWKGNLSFIKSHFKNSPLKNNVPLLLAVILILEIVTSIFLVVGGFHIIVNSKPEFAIIGVALSSLTLFFLLIGQRLAKDYAGAMTLAVYFIITILGFFFFKPIVFFDYV